MAEYVLLRAEMDFLAPLVLTLGTPPPQLYQLLPITHIMLSFHLIIVCVPMSRVIGPLLSKQTKERCQPLTKMQNIPFFCFPIIPLECAQFERRFSSSALQGPKEDLRFAWKKRSVPRTTQLVSDLVTHKFKIKVQQRYETKVLLPPAEKIFCSVPCFNKIVFLL